MSDNFRFAPELFEQRNTALEILESADITQFVDFMGIDLDHKYYGISVSGIADRSTAKRIHDVLRPHFPEFPNTKISRSCCDKMRPHLVNMFREGI